MTKCFLRDRCNGKDCDKDFCLRKYKVDSLYSAALMTDSQKQHIKLSIDADGTDLEQFKQLAEIEKDIRHGAFFMTNHRDICMDATWLTFLLRNHYFIHPYSGIGNNLFGKWWIQHVVRTLRAFVVIRNGSFREQLMNATILSEYIRTLRKRHKSIWLAQREGRAKDGNDVTQPGVLKMLTIDSEDFFESIKELNIYYL